MPRNFNLEQNRCLLERDFPGYKLSLLEVPRATIRLNSSVNIIYPTNEQYSFKHAKLFATHNQILAAEYEYLEDAEVFYYVGSDQCIYKIKWDLLGIEEMSVNWKIPSVIGNPQTTYNITMQVLNDKYVIVANGSGSLYILDKNGSEWKCVFNDTLNFPFVLLDCNIKNLVLHVLLFDIEFHGDAEKKHKSALHWIVYEIDDSNWMKKTSKKMISESELHFATFGKGDDNDDLYIVSTEGGFGNDELPLKKSLHFTWCQDEETIMIFIDASEVITSNSKQLKIKKQAELIIDHTLQNDIDQSLTNWTFNNNTKAMEITLYKLKKSVWPCLFEGDVLPGEYLADEKTAKEVHEKLQHLCSDNVVEEIPTKTSTLTDRVEECDFVSAKGSLFECLSSDLSVTHRGLFNQEAIFLKNNTFAIQQNEDICLYQAAQRGDNWRLEHYGTLHAMGYIRASKQRRKFTSCAPDLSYSVIAESSRHIFIYRQNVDVTSGELRHRSTGKQIKQLAQQQVIELEKSDEILGIHATNKVLFVLLQDKLYAFNMK